MKCKTAFLTFFLVYSIQCASHAAAPLCESLFGPAKVVDAKSKEKKWTPSTELYPYKGELNEAALKKSNFEIDSEGFLYDKSDKDKKLGKVLVAKSDYLFQWADKDYYEAIIEQGGINTSWMDTILSSTPQVAGRGFYVSMNPIDSMSYGTHLTTFKTTGDIVILEFFSRAQATLGSKQLLKRLAKTGIDAISADDYTNYNGKKTWLSMISSRQLLDLKRDPIEVIDYAALSRADFELARRPQFTALLNRKLDAIWSTSSSVASDLRLLNNNWHTFDRSVWKQVAAEPFSRLALGKASANDLKLIADKFRDNNLNPKDGSLLEEWYKQLGSLLLNAKKPHDLKDVLEIFRSVKGNDFQNGFEAKVLSQIDFSRLMQSQTLEASYAKVLEYYDMSTVVGSLDGKLSEPITLEEMKKKANISYAKLDGYLAKTENWSWSKIEKLAQDIYGIKYNPRKEAVIMTEEGTRNSYRMNLSSQVYQNLKNNSVLKISNTSKQGDQIKAMVEYGDLTDKQNQISLDHILSAINATNSGNRTTRDNYYHDFISIHPYIDGNGRMSRLVYALLAKSSYVGKDRLSVGLPIYNWDLFLTPDEFKQQQLIGTLLKKWVRVAKNDEEFVLRCRWGVRILEQMYPHLGKAH